MPKSQAADRYEFSRRRPMMLETGYACLLVAIFGTVFGCCEVYGVLGTENVNTIDGGVDG